MIRQGITDFKSRYRGSVSLKVCAVGWVDIHSVRNGVDYSRVSPHSHLNSTIYISRLGRDSRREASLSTRCFREEREFFLPHPFLLLPSPFIHKCVQKPTH